MTLTIVNSGIGAYLSGDAYIKALIMGEPGAGKTRSASFWPSPIFANCERKSMSLLDRNVPVANIGAVADMEQLMLVLRADGQRPLPERKYKTLVIDTFDAYQRTMINERLTKEHREKFINDDWNWLGTKTSQLLERISNLPMNVVINLHVKDVTEGEGDDRVVKQKPHLKGDVKDQIAAEFDLVGYMESYWSVEGSSQQDREKVLRRRIQWVQDERHPILKDCSGQLGTYTTVDFTDEDFTRIWEPIFIANDRLDSFPESTAVEVDVPGEVVTPAAPAPTGPIAGGPTVTADQATQAATPKKAPPRKAAAKAATKPPAKAQPAASGASAAPASPETPPAAAPSPAEPPQQPVEQPPAASTDTATPVATQEESTPEAPAPAVDENAEAVSALAEGGVTGDVVSEAPAADPTPVSSPAEPPAPAAAPAAQRCGDGEPAPAGKFDGCGKDLTALPAAQRDRAELAWMRWRVRLCGDCFEKAKNNQLPARAA